MIQKDQSKLMKALFVVDNNFPFSSDENEIEAK